MPLTTSNSFNGSAIPSRVRDSDGSIIPIGDITSQLGNITTQGYGEDNDESSTSSGTYQEKLTLNTTITDAGNYLVMWQYQVNSTNGNGKVEGRFREDTTILQELRKEGQDANVISGFYIRTLTAASHSWDIYWRKAQGGGSSEIRNARIMLLKLN